EYGVSISIGYGVFSSLSNTAYSLKLINTAYPLLLGTAYRSSDKIRMTKVIKEEFDKFEDVKHEADDDMGYDPSDVAFIKWLGLKIFNYKTMDHYTMKALWIYWIRGDDEVELTDEE
ncbi:hypothetical protein Tco_1481714, partial [Tanacetum coccineum]